MALIHSWKHKGELPRKDENGFWIEDIGLVTEKKRELRREALSAGTFEGQALVTITYVVPDMTVPYYEVRTSDELIYEAMVEAGVCSRDQLEPPQHKYVRGRKPRVKVQLEAVDDYEGGYY